MIDAVNRHLRAGRLPTARAGCRSPASRRTRGTATLRAPRGDGQRNHAGHAAAAQLEDVRAGRRARSRRRLAARGAVDEHLHAWRIGLHARACPAPGSAVLRGSSVRRYTPPPPSTITAAATAAISFVGSAGRLVFCLQAVAFFFVSSGSSCSNNGLSESIDESPRGARSAAEMSSVMSRTPTGVGGRRPRRRERFVVEHRGLDRGSREKLRCGRRRWHMQDGSRCDRRRRRHDRQARWPQQVRGYERLGCHWRWRGYGWRWDHHRRRNRRHGRCGPGAVAAQAAQRRGAPAGTAAVRRAATSPAQILPQASARARRDVAREERLERDGAATNSESSASTSSSAVCASVADSKPAPEVELQRARQSSRAAASGSG